MIVYSSASLHQTCVHFVGNPSNDDALSLSESLLEIQDDDQEQILNYLMRGFKPEAFFKFTTNGNLVYDASYRETTNGTMDFGMATYFAKKGKRVARKGWNGSGMFAYIVPAASYPAQTGAAKAFFGENSMVPYRAYWALKTAQDDVATWTPSGSDTLAEDWYVID